MAQKNKDSNNLLKLLVIVRHCLVFNCWRGRLSNILAFYACVWCKTFSTFEKPVFLHYSIDKFDYSIQYYFILQRENNLKCLEIIIMHTLWKTMPGSVNQVPKDSTEWDRTDTGHSTDKHLDVWYQYKTIILNPSSNKL